MSKGKYKRKRQRAKVHAEQQLKNLAKIEVIAPQNKTLAPKSSLPDGYEKKKENMAPREIPKGNTLTNWLLAIFTVILTAVACFQWFVTKHQLDVMRNDERAWLEVKSMPTDPSRWVPVAGRRLAPSMQLVNIGKTAAKRITVDVFVDVNATKQRVRLGCVGASIPCAHGNETFGIFFPNEQQSVEAVRVLDNGRDWLSTDSDVEDWTNRQIYSAAYGIVTYEDVFHEPHWTKFCFFNAAPGTTVSARDCTDYNDAN
jgi:hypothetical protein